MKQIPIALQLYTVRDDAEKDLVGTFSSLSAIGYTHVELAGLYEQSSSHLKTLLDNAGLKPTSAHVGLDLITGSESAKTIEDYLSLGVSTFIVPWLSPDLRLEGAGYPAVADKLNEAGELLSRYGSILGYHNHDFEFAETLDGKPGIEILIANTDPALVTFELDTYWALYGGHDPVDFITRHGTRLSLLHIKDLDPEDRSFAPVGTGLLPLDGIISAAVDAEVNYLIVEQDKTKGPALEAVKISLDNLKAKGYA